MFLILEDLTCPFQVWLKRRHALVVARSAAGQLICLRSGKRRQKSSDLRAVSECLFIIGNAPSAENALGQPPGYGPKTRRKQRNRRKRPRLRSLVLEGLSWRKSARGCSSAKALNAEKGLRACFWASRPCQENTSSK